MCRDAVMAALAATLWVAGCAGPDNATVGLRMGSLESFIEDVAWHVEQRCAQGGCHGRPERLFSLYAPGIHRADPDRRYLDEPLSVEELAENARSVAAFAQVADPRRSLLLCKPLAREEGGCWHLGGDNFEDRTDPAYRALLSWMLEAVPHDGGTW
jgi:hypothetical protein